MTPERLECGYCGKRTMTLNPHPDAGKPEHLLTVGSMWVCIPCMTKSRHSWAKEAIELKELCSSQQERIKEMEKYIEVLETYWGIPDRVNEYNNPVTFAARKKIQEALKE